MTDFRTQLLKAKEMQGIFHAYPPRKFADGQIVIVPPKNAAVVRFAIPATLIDTDRSWAYACSLPENPDAWSYFSESHLVDLTDLQVDPDGNALLILKPHEPS